MQPAVRLGEYSNTFLPESFAVLDQLSATCWPRRSKSSFDTRNLEKKVFNLDALVETGAISPKDIELFQFARAGARWTAGDLLAPAPAKTRNGERACN
jgi:hypothetical protein